MTGLLSAISGHFNRALIFGTVLPVVTFLTLGGWLLQSWLPGDPPWHVLAVYGAEWQAVAAFLAVALGSGVLHSINVPLTRVYEGYPWEDSFVGRWRVAKYRRDRRQLAARWRGYRTLRYALEDETSSKAAGASAADRTALATEHSRIGRTLAERFPPENQVLPTRLGNAIRAFEAYPNDQYGIAAITIWPRLVAVIDKEYAGAIAEQKTSFDFMLNSSALAMTCAAMLAIVGVTLPVPFASTGWLLLWTAQIAALIALSYWCYEGAIGRAVAWGQMIKGAFDLFRHDLLRKLGYTTMPATLTEERRVWRMLSQQIIFGDTRRVFVPAFDGATTYVEVEPSWLMVTVHRSVDPPDASGRQRVHVRVANEDRSRQGAKTVVLVERLAANTDLVHGSLHPVRSIDGINPIRIPLGALGAGVTADLHFDVVRYKT